MYTIDEPGDAHVVERATKREQEYIGLCLHIVEHLKWVLLMTYEDVIATRVGQSYNQELISSASTVCTAIDVMRNKLTLLTSSCDSVYQRVSTVARGITELATIVNRQIGDATNQPWHDDKSFTTVSLLDEVAGDIESTNPLMVLCKELKSAIVTLHQLRAGMHCTNSTMAPQLLSMMDRNIIVSDTSERPSVLGDIIFALARFIGHLSLEFKAAMNNDSDWDSSITTAPVIETSADGGVTTLDDKTTPRRLFTGGKVDAAVGTSRSRVSLLEDRVQQLTNSISATTSTAAVRSLSIPTARSTTPYCDGDNTARTDSSVNTFQLGLSHREPHFSHKNRSIQGVYTERSSTMSKKQATKSKRKPLLMSPSIGSCSTAYGSKSAASLTAGSHNVDGHLSAASSTTAFTPLTTFEAYQDDEALENLLEMSFQKQIPYPSAEQSNDCADEQCDDEGLSDSTSSAQLEFALPEPRSCVLRADYESLLQRLKKLLSEKELLKIQLISTARKLETMRGTNRHAEMVLQRNAELEIALAGEQMDRYESVRTLESRCEEMLSEKESLSKTANALQAEVSVANDEIAELNERLNNLSLQIQFLSQHEEEAQLLRSKLRTLEEESSKERVMSKGKMEQLDDEKNSLADQLEQKRSELETLVGTNEQAEVLMRMNAALESAIVEIQNEKDAAVGSLQSDLFNLQVDSEKNLADIGKDRRRCEDLSNQLKGLSDRVTGLKEENKKLRMDQAESEDLLQKLREKETTIAQLRGQLEGETHRLRGQLELKEGQLASMRGINEHAELVLQRNTELERLVEKLQSSPIYDGDEAENHIKILRKEKAKIETLYQAAVNSKTECVVKFNDLQDESYRERANAISAANADALLEYEKKLEAKESEIMELLRIEKENSIQVKQDCKKEMQMAAKEQKHHVKKLIDNHMGEMKTLKSLMESEIRKLKQTKEEELRKLVITNDETVRRIRGKHNEELKVLEQKYEISIKAVKVELESQLEQKELNLQVTEAKWQLKFSENEQKYEGDSVHEQEVERRLQAKDEEFLELMSKVKDEVNSERSEADKKLEVALQAVKQKEKEKEDEITKIKQESSRKMNSLVANADSQLRTLQERLNATMEDGNNKEQVVQYLRESLSSTQAILDKQEDVIAKERLTRNDQRSLSDQLEAANEQIRNLLRRNEDIENVMSTLQGTHEEETKSISAQLSMACAERNIKNAALRRALKQIDEVEQKLKECEEENTKYKSEEQYLTSQREIADTSRQRLLTEQLEVKKLRLQNNSQATSLKEKDRQLKNLFPSSEKVDVMLSRNAVLEERLKISEADSEAAKKQILQLKEIRVDNELKQKTVELLQRQLLENESLLSNRRDDITSLSSLCSPSSQSDKSKKLLIKMKELELSADSLVGEKNRLETELARERARLTEQLHVKDRQLSLLTSAQDYSRELLKRNTELEGLVDKLSQQRELSMMESNLAVKEDHRLYEYELRTARIETIRDGIRREFEKDVQDLMKQGMMKNEVADTLRQKIRDLEAERSKDQARIRSAVGLCETVPELELRNNILTTEIIQLRRRLAVRQERHSGTTTTGTTTTGTTSTGTTSTVNNSDGLDPISLQLIEQLEHLLLRCKALEKAVDDLQNTKDADLEMLKANLSSIVDENEQHLQAFDGLKTTQELYTKRFKSLSQELESVQREKSVLEQQLNATTPAALMCGITRTEVTNNERIRELLEEVEDLRVRERRAYDEMDSYRAKTESLQSAMTEVEMNHLRSLDQIHKRLTLLQENLDSKERTLEIVREQQTIKDAEIAELRACVDRYTSGVSPSPSTSSAIRSAIVRRRSLGNNGDLQKVKKRVSALRCHVENIKHIAITGTSPRKQDTHTDTTRQEYVDDEMFDCSDDVLVDLDDYSSSCDVAEETDARKTSTETHTSHMSGVKLMSTVKLCNDTLPIPSLPLPNTTPTLPLIGSPMSPNSSVLTPAPPSDRMPKRSTKGDSKQSAVDRGTSKDKMDGVVVIDPPTLGGPTIPTTKANCSPRVAKRKISETLKCNDRSDDEMISSELCVSSRSMTSQQRRPDQDIASLFSNSRELLTRKRRIKKARHSSIHMNA